MALAFSVVIGVLVGLVLGGRIGRLADLQLRAMPLFAVALGLQVLAFPSAAMPWTVGEDLATGLWLATYGVLIVIAVANRGVTGVPVLALGMASNLAAILANGGHMPALPSAMADAGVAYDGVHMNSVGDPSPHLGWLVDRWGAPEWVPAANVYSIGDVILAVGAILVVAAAMGARPALPRRRHAGGETRTPTGHPTGS